MPEKSADLTLWHAAELSRHLILKIQETDYGDEAHFDNCPALAWGVK